jgi:hypothetical protein
VAAAARPELRAFLLPDMAALRKEAEAKKVRFSVPGARVKREALVRARA